MKTQPDVSSDELSKSRVHHEVGGYFLRTTWSISQWTGHEIYQRFSEDTLYLIGYMTEKKQMCLWAHKTFRFETELTNWKLSIVYFFEWHLSFWIWRRPFLSMTLSRSHRRPAFCLAYDLRASQRKVLLVKYKRCSQANNSGPMLITFLNVHTHLPYPACWLHCITWAKGKLLFQPAKCHQIQMEPTGLAMHAESTQLCLERLTEVQVKQENRQGEKNGLENIP